MRRWTETGCEYYRLGCAEYMRDLLQRTYPNRKYRIVYRRDMWVIEQIERRKRGKR